MPLYKIHILGGVCHYNLSNYNIYIARKICTRFYKHVSSYCQGTTSEELAFIISANRGRTCEMTFLYPETIAGAQLQHDLFKEHAHSWTRQRKSEALNKLHLLPNPIASTSTA